VTHHHHNKLLITLKKITTIINSMEQSPSGKANCSWASQEIQCTLCNLQIHYCLHDSHLSLSSAKSIPFMPPTPILLPPDLLFISSSHLRLDLPSGLSLPHASTAKPCMHILSPPYLSHAPYNSFFLIWSTYLAISTDHKAPHYEKLLHFPVIPPV